MASTKLLVGQELEAVGTSQDQSMTDSYQFGERLDLDGESDEERFEPEDGN